jgi:hypothetical protein
VRLGLDAGLGGLRVAAEHQLAVDEHRVGGAVDELFAVRLLLEQDPGVGRAEGPFEERPGGRLVGDGDAGQADALPRRRGTWAFHGPWALHGQGPAVFNRHDAHHGGVGGCGDAEDEDAEGDSEVHGVLCGAETAPAPRKDAFRGGEVQDSTHKSLTRDAAIVTCDAASVTCDAASVTCDAASVTRDAARVTCDAASVTRDAARVTRDAARVTRDAARVTRDAARVTRDAASVTRDAARVTRDPASVTRDGSSVAIRRSWPAG